MSLYILRHCESMGQHAEAPLSLKGSQNAQLLKVKLKELGIRKVITSPYLRAIESVMPYANDANLEIEINKNFKERILGDVGENWKDSFKRTFYERDLSFPNGETSNQVFARVNSYLQQQMKLFDEPTLIATHGNVIALLANIRDPEEAYFFWQNLATPDIFLYTEVENNRLSRVECPVLNQT